MRVVGSVSVCAVGAAVEVVAVDRHLQIADGALGPLALHLLNQSFSTYYKSMERDSKSLLVTVLQVDSRASRSSYHLK